VIYNPKVTMEILDSLRQDKSWRLSELARRKIAYRTSTVKMDASFREEIEHPVTELEPICFDADPNGQGKLNDYAILEKDGKPIIRVDLYRSPDDDNYSEAVDVWGDWMVIGFGHHVYLIDIHNKHILPIDLGSDFFWQYPLENVLLATSVERLFCIDPDGKVKWTTGQVGLHGVMINNISGNVISGIGKWDRKEDWRPFQVYSDSGKLLLKQK